MHGSVCAQRHVHLAAGVGILEGIWLVFGPLKQAYYYTEVRALA